MLIPTFLVEGVTIAMRAYLSHMLLGSPLPCEPSSRPGELLLVALGILQRGARLDMRATHVDWCMALSFLADWDEGIKVASPQALGLFLGFFGAIPALHILCSAIV